MKAISIKQPWASLIAHGIKDIENRNWKCPQKYIGQRVLIHASKTVVGWRESPLNFHQREVARKYGFSFDELPKGAIIGSVLIAACVKNNPSVWADMGCWNWLLKDAVLFDKPILNVKGKLSFWDFNMDDYE